MSIIDRGRLDEALDALDTRDTWFTHKFDIAAQRNTLTDILDSIDEASSNNPQMREFTDLMRNNPQLGSAFHAHMRTNGAETLDAVEAAIEAGDLSEARLQEIFQVARAGQDFEVSAGRGVSEQQANFLNSLGVTQEEFDRYGFWNQSEHGEITRNIIGERTPEQFLNAVRDAGMIPAETVDLIQADPELAQAVHSAVVNDPTMLEGLQQVAAGEAGGFTIDQLNEVLQNDLQRGVLTQVLEKIGDGSLDAGGADIDFSHLQALAAADNDAARLAALQDIGVSAFGAAGIGSFNDFLDLMRDPDEFIANFLSSIEGLPPEWQNALAGIMSGFMPVIAEMLDPNGFMLQPYTQLVREYSPVLQRAGAEVMSQATTTFETTAERTGETPDRGSTASEQRAAASVVTRPDPTVLDTRVAEVWDAPAP
ncbi:MAG: hypothetical protein AAF549_01845 [Pseudomonadota bacterium]